MAAKMYSNLQENHTVRKTEPVRARRGGWGDRLLSERDGIYKERQVKTETCEHLFLTEHRQPMRKHNGGKSCLVTEAAVLLQSSYFQHWCAADISLLRRGKLKQIKNLKVYHKLS